MTSDRASILVLPGIDGSCAAHWQQRWVAGSARMSVVEQREWTSPTCRDWVETLGNAVDECAGDTVIVAHSLGCLLVAHWAASTRPRIRGALLVAPPADDHERLRQRVRGFFPVLRQPLPFPTFLVASRNDPYAHIEQSRAYANAWGSTLIDVGTAGHINADSGLGCWPFGLELLQSLVMRCGDSRSVA